ncbi:C40 family peptidase [Arenibaculum pallidiluteum]|uniref:C40 family peptidase n=1 Tax=Arenibaculum pallidiluteum TaxID=2812559 RepID=UPI001A977683|nr:C40 family peptidase [Arenibaculum pallidiluteum]
MKSPDPRVTPYRDDLAASHLRGIVEAPRYADGVAHRMRQGRATLRGEPTDAARQTSELIFGETFTVYDRRDGWAWGQCGTDGYVGWTPASALEEGPLAPTHQVSALRTFLFPEADLKTHPRDDLSQGALVAVARTQNGWSELATGGWIFAKHLTPVGAPPADMVDTALAFLGVPYLWGGRTSLGIDCSGLAQRAMAASGRNAPRDSDQQRAAVGTLVSENGQGFAYRRGDLVFFPGHVGLMLDGTRLLHATAFSLSVCVEPLDEVAARAGGILAVRRLD